jgi:hypothetical protein
MIQFDRCKRCIEVAGSWFGRTFEQVVKRVSETAAFKTDFVEAGKISDELQDEGEAGWPFPASLLRNASFGARTEVVFRFISVLEFRRIFDLEPKQLGCVAVPFVRLRFACWSLLALSRALRAMTRNHPGNNPEPPRSKPEPIWNQPGGAGVFPGWFLSWSIAHKTQPQQVPWPDELGTDWKGVFCRPDGSQPDDSLRRVIFHYDMSWSKQEMHIDAMRRLRLTEVDEGLAHVQAEELKRRPKDFAEQFAWFWQSGGAFRL